MAAKQKLAWVGGAAMAALWLSACSKDAPRIEPAAPPAAPAEMPAPSPQTPPAPTGDVPPPNSAEPAPSPTPEPPPPTEPSPVPKPTSVEPTLDAMNAAIASTKMSVPVDLRYQFATEPRLNQPVTLHLAAVPRVAGTRLHVSIKAAEGLRVESGAMEIQKAAATSAYRQQLSVTRLAAAPENLRVLVTMEMPEGTAFGYYSIPLASGKTAHKQHSVKQR